MGKIEIVLRRADTGQVTETVLAVFEEKGGTITKPDILIFPNLEIRLKEHSVYRNGKSVFLTQREFDVLAYLSQRPKWVFSAEQIYEEVWGEDGENCGTAVASVIGQIRRKLTPDMPKAGYIRTVLGSGYKFEVPQDIAE